MAAPRPYNRTSFAKIREPLEVPNLLDLQITSFDWLVGNETWQARVAEARTADIPTLRRDPVTGAYRPG